MLPLPNIANPDGSTDHIQSSKLEITFYMFIFLLIE